MTTCECENLFSRIFPFWKDLSSGDKDFLCANSKYAKYKKGANVHGGSSGCTGGIVVKSGCLRVYLLSDEGKEVTLYRLFPGDICMLAASCVIKAITFEVFVDSEEDSECYIVNGNAFSKLSDKNVYVENFALNVAVNRFSDVIWVIQQILFMSLDKRLAVFLLDESIKNDSDTIELNREQIAKYIGSAREAVSRMLKYFAAEGIINNSRSGITIIDKRKLRELTV